MGQHGWRRAICRSRYPGNSLQRGHGRGVGPVESTNETHQCRLRVVRAYHPSPDVKLSHLFRRFYFESERGLFPNTEFVYDLELPVEFTPENADGEVETFELLPANECLEKMFTPDFKTTSAPVALDFLIRHGVITPENGEIYNGFLSRGVMTVGFCCREGIPEDNRAITRSFTVDLRALRAIKTTY